MSLTEKAIAALRRIEEASQQRAAENRAEVLAYANKRFAQIFDQAPDRVEDHDFYCDGLHFVYVPPKYGDAWSRHGHFVLIGKCPRCGEECFSESIVNLATLGEMLDEFGPDSTFHACASDEEAAEAEPESWEDRLADAIREAIEAELAGREGWDC